ncbi:hypothetical protein [uncultured Cohaesibacter sp.]|uniref:hypothetical protein n=1 Tax=uncultured Cohaesibacter sp. TaxID=1002546 RepID=UPI0029C639FD|nr:hypothetical protein [uncultured Cohaesibacter sp.]
MNMKKQRISERQLIEPTLKILSRAPSGFMSTSHLIDALEELMKPEGKDAELITDRNDTHFSQIVRNMVSHKNSPNNIIYLGYVTYDSEKKGLQITELGYKKAQE